MNKLNLADKIAIGLFVFGMAFAITQRINYQTIPENNIVEVLPESDHLVNPAS